MKLIFKILIHLVAFISLAGCRIATIVVEGGSVTLPPNYALCEPENVCMVEVQDTQFSHMFVAHPEQGWYLDHWQAGNGFLCGNLKRAGCLVSIAEIEEETAEKIVASSETVYLMPIFRPVHEIIEVQGKAWYQPYLFVGRTWDDINAVCPDGVCNGSMNGYDLTGWIWASVKDMSDFFNYYYGSQLLGPGPGFVQIFPPQSTNAPDIFSYGWTPTSAGASGRILEGWTRNAINSDPAAAWSAIWADYSHGRTSVTIGTGGKSKFFTTIGAWFYRVP